MKINQISVFCTIFLILAGCGSVSETTEQEVWDYDRCIEEGGLVILQPSICLVGETEHPMDSSSYYDGEFTRTEWSDDELLNALRELGEPLDFIWDVESPIIGEVGKTAVISGELVFFFQYLSIESAQEERSSMQEKGEATDGSIINWGTDVHFAGKGAVIAVYVGSNPDVIDLLSQAESVLD